MNQKSKHFILAIFSLILLISTAFISRVANNAEQSKKVSFGYPLSFISQDVSGQNSFYFPCYYRFESARFKDINVSPIRLAGSFLAIFLLLEIAVFIFEFLDFWARKIIFRYKDSKE